jgi:hypothetical protein
MFWVYYLENTVLSLEDDYSVHCIKIYGKECREGQELALNVSFKAGNMDFLDRIIADRAIPPTPATLSLSSTPPRRCMHTARKFLQK